MARLIKVATCSVNAYQHGIDTADAVMERTLAQVDQAGRDGADIVCTPEFSAAAWDTTTGHAQASPLTDRWVQAFATLASKHRMYVIAATVERSDDGRNYNTAVLLDRRGEIAGLYRKTHLCLPDYQEGLLFDAGDELPTFTTDFGKIAVAICMDIHYPEVFTTFALKGAEIVFWPTAAMDYTGDLLESLVNARAIDNQVFFVPSHYISLPYLAGKPYGRSRVVDPMGRIRADTGHFPGVAMAQIDLDQTYPMWYEGDMLKTYPDMRRTLFKTRRPKLYSELTRTTQESD